MQKWKKKKSSNVNPAVNKSPSKSPIKSPIKSPSKTKDSSGQRTRLASESDKRRGRSRLTSESRSPTKSKSVINLSPGKQTSEMKKSRSSKSLGKLRNDTGPGVLNDYASYVKSGINSYHIMSNEGRN